MKEEIKAGIIIISSLLILSVFVILIGGSRFYQKSDKYYVRVMNAAGLETGAQVKLGGVRVGRVLDIREPEGPGKPVTIVIGLKTGTPVYKGTVAVVTQIGFVGDIYLLLSVDKAMGGLIRAGADIPSEESVEFTKLMARLDGLSQTLDNLVRDIDRLFSSRNVSNIEQLVGNTNRAILSGSSNFEKVANSLRSATDRLEKVLDEATDLLKSNKGEVSHLIKKAQDDLDKASEMMKGIESAAKTVGRTSGSVDKALDLQSRNIGNLIDTMTKTAEDLQDLLQEIKRKPWSMLYKEGKGE